MVPFLVRPFQDWEVVATDIVLACHCATDFATLRALPLRLLALGAASILAGWFYTGGPKPYGYYGFGELFVFVLAQPEVY